MMPVRPPYRKSLSVDHHPGGVWCTLLGPQAEASISVRRLPPRFFVVKVVARSASPTPSILLGCLSAAVGVPHCLANRRSTCSSLASEMGNPWIYPPNTNHWKVMGQTGLTLWLRGCGVARRGLPSGPLTFRK